MVINNFQVQHILRTYSQQLAQGSRTSKSKAQKGSFQKDEVTLSSESKKRWVVDRVAQEIIDQLASGSEPSPTAREVRDQLGSEYGRLLEVSRGEDQEIVFKTLDEAQGTKESLPSSENERLRRKLVEIAHSVVYKNLEQEEHG
jgi:hypothetical protein